MNYLEQKIKSIESFCDFMESGGAERPVAPLEVNLEVSNVCNFKCAMCETFSKLNTHRHWLLRAEDRKFQDFDFDQLNGVIRNSLMVHCFGYGEVTIHPRFDQLLSHLSDFGVLVDFFTNAQEMDEAFSRLVLDANVAKIIISFSGSNQSQYDNIYLGGDFDKVVNNIKTLSRLKRERGSSFPRIEINSLGFKHHVAALPEFVRLMADAGANAITLKPLLGAKHIPHLHQHIAFYREDIEGPLFKEAHELAMELGIRLNTMPFESGVKVEPGQDENEILSRMIRGGKISAEVVSVGEIGALSEEVPLAPANNKEKQDHGNAMMMAESELADYLSMEDHLPDQDVPCLEPFQRFYIKNNGDVKPCCFGLPVNVGNIHTHSSDEIWEGIGYRTIQEGILSNRYPMNLCRTCLQRRTYPKSHFLVNKVNLYKEWLLECHGVVFPQELFERVRNLPASVRIE